MRPSLLSCVPSMLGIASLLPLSAGCSGAKGLLSVPADGGTSSSSGGGGSSGASSGASSGGGSSGASSSGGGDAGNRDGGETDEGGSCPPCDPANVNLPGSSCDLDCSGSNKPPASCDKGLAVGGPAGDFAKALGICQMATDTTWGLVSATYTTGYGSASAPSAGQHALLPGFGSVITPREGSNLGVLSSGYALLCDDASQATTCAGSGTGDPYFKGQQTAQNTANGTPPPGYPKGTTGCATTSTIFDTIGVTLVIKVPKNVAGMSFDFDFYSSDWPEYVCSSFNDEFVAWLQSSAWSGNAGDFNVSLDATGSPISVNTPLLDRCTPDTAVGCSGSLLTTTTATCAAGPGELLGTGFSNIGTYCTTESTGGGATGWLTSTAPVLGGETITLQLIIWDTGDANWDSSVLIDNLRWYAAPQTVKTTPPVLTP